MNRKDKLAAKAMERKGLKGDWGAWRKSDPSLEMIASRGWLGEVRAVWANNLYAVLCRPVFIEDGDIVTHLAIRTISSKEPPWRDLQRIKNELFDDEATAVQVMPPESELIDEADMYHIWVLPKRLPFTLAYNRVAA